MIVALTAYELTFIYYDTCIKKYVWTAGLMGTWVQELVGMEMNEELKEYL